MTNMHDKDSSNPGIAPAQTSERKPLDVSALVAGTPQWAHVEVLESTGSTNADVKHLAEQGAPDRTAVVASNQTSGRGRLARQWEAPANSSIALSALFRPLGLSATQLGLLPLACGLAVVDMIVEAAGISPNRVGLKWPNDVLLDGRKVCGILVEAASLAPAALVPGIGVNVDLTEEELPVPHAISLAMAGATCLDRTVLSAALLNALHRRELQWRNDTAGMLRDYRKVCLTIGTAVRAELPDGSTLVGTATDIRSDGELQVTTADGVRHVVAAGDVSHVRAVDGGYASGNNASGHE